MHILHSRVTLQVRFFMSMSTPWITNALDKCLAGVDGFVNNKIRNSLFLDMQGCPRLYGAFDHAAVLKVTAWNRWKMWHTLTAADGRRQAKNQRRHMKDVFGLYGAPQLAAITGAPIVLSIKTTTTRRNQCTDRISASFLCRVSVEKLARTLRLLKLLSRGSWRSSEGKGGKKWFVEKGQIQCFWRFYAIWRRWLSFIGYYGWVLIFFVMFYLELWRWACSIKVMRTKRDYEAIKDTAILHACRHLHQISRVN